MKNAATKEKKSDTSKKSKKRTYPRKKVHRKMLELTTTQDQVDMLIKQTVREYRRAQEAQQEYDNWIWEMFIQGIIEPGNEHLDEQDKQDSMTLYHGTGKYRVAIGRNRDRKFDDRSHQAKVYIQDFINEHEESTLSDPDVKMMIDMLKGMFFSSRKQGGFKFTPQLHDFMTMDSDNLHDERLKKAQRILRDSLRVEASKWYSRVEEYNEATGEYEPIE